MWVRPVQLVSGSSGSAACWHFTGDRKIVWGLSRKTIQNDTIDMENSVGVGGEADDARQ
jgi:hypothetical protein